MHNFFLHVHLIGAIFDTDLHVCAYKTTKLYYTRDCSHHPYNTRYFINVMSASMISRLKVT